MAETTITPRTNGPYLVKGDFKIVDPDGNEFKVDRDTVALCRCGGSVNKPFCDGTHSKLGFDAATKAVQQAEKKAE
ncbi:MAG: CDGSH iron-sulfur domain-containing protein, partial [Dehalococcoidia bacterium]